MHYNSYTVVPNPTRYDIQIKSVIPALKRAELPSRRQCYIGISVANPFFYGESLNSLLEWIANRYSSVCILIDDLFHRHNIMMETGLDEADSIAIAGKLADDTEKRVKRALSLLSSRSCEFVVVRSSKLGMQHSFHRYLNQLKQVYETNHTFSEKIDKSAIGYISRQEKHAKQMAVERERAIALSSLYLLEEIAAFALLGDLGFNVDVYPGPELPVLIDIAKGYFKDMPAPLMNRINVELKISKT